MTSSPTQGHLLKISRRHPVPEGELTFEPSRRRVRGIVGGVTVVDSRNPVLIWEPGFPVPRYAFGAGDVRTDLLVPTDVESPARRPGATQVYDLVIDGDRRREIAWSYGPGDLEGLLGFDWFLRSKPGIDHWYEEEEEIFVHPRDPYKRVDPIQSTRHVTVSIHGVQVADTHRPILLFETRMPTRYYIPAEDVDFSALTETELLTRCPYKGLARYWSFTGEPAAENIVWSYPDPIPAAATITDYLSFYNEFVDIVVDGEPEARPVSVFSKSRD